jgi:hypothetical protein
MANTIGEKELKTDWPIEEGLEARTTKQTGRVMNLVPEEGSIVLERYKELL